MLAQRPRPTYTANAADGSRTITIHDVPTPEAGSDGEVSDSGPSQPRPVLKLRGGPRSTQRVAWRPEVIDNENCGKKKSKICCIYHKPKRFDESSDESESDESGDDGRARPAKSRKKPHRHDHHDDDGCGDSGPSGSESSSSPSAVASSSATVTQLESPRAPNAYEVQPKPKSAQ
ncbi:hypothetical protein DL93DRAFT_1307602 [Clavulina sp. PMI_390]|nr:hypothetical protein DL93DRAFT_1307602 [Clavulina sp. PMI_390]